MKNLTCRKAKIDDLAAIITLFREDDLGREREVEIIPGAKVAEGYLKAFKAINSDANQYLMVVENDSQIVATCHLTIVYYLTHIGSSRLQIEAVRVAEKYRGQNIGQWMIQQAINYGKDKGVKIIQLTTDKKRIKAHKFYEKLGFKASHEGMKINLK